MGAAAIPIAIIGGSVLAGGASILGSALTKKSQDKYSSDVKETNKENLEFQKEQFEYEKDLQSTIMEREDNAVQRKVADQRAAGISPLVDMAGAESSGVAGVAVNAPQKGMPAAPGDAQPLAAALQAVGTLGAAAQTIAQVQNIQANTAASKAQTDFLTQTASTRSQTLDEQLRSIISRNEFSDLSTADQLEHLKLQNKLDQQSYDWNQEKRDIDKLTFKDLKRELDFRSDNDIYTSRPSSWQDALMSLAYNGQEKGPAAQVQRAAGKISGAVADITDDVIGVVDDLTGKGDKDFKQRMRDTADTFAKYNPFIRFGSAAYDYLKNRK